MKRKEIEVNKINKILEEKLNCYLSITNKTILEKCLGDIAYEAFNAGIKFIQDSLENKKIKKYGIKNVRDWIENARAENLVVDFFGKYWDN